MYVCMNRFVLVRVYFTVRWVGVSGWVNDVMFILMLGLLGLWIFPTFCDEGFKLYGYLGAMVVGW